MSNKILEIKNLSHKYTKNWAIRDINLEVDSTGVIGLLGSNGAGKSTMINIICGVVVQSEGEVLINGVNTMKNAKMSREHLGFLPQQAPLHKDLTVREYLKHCAIMRQVDSADIPAAIDMAMAKCGIEHFADRVIKNLSGGYKQRVGIAQSIIHNPAFVVLDEPTNGLDPNQILGVRKLILQIAKERAVLMSTHILSEVQAICERIVMIEHGNVVFSGNIRDFNNYIEPSTMIVVTPFADETEEYDIFQAVEGVKHVEKIAKSTLRIHFTSNDNIVGKVSTLCYNKGIELSEIYLESESLDIVFAKLSGKSI